MHRYKQFFKPKILYKNIITFNLKAVIRFVPIVVKAISLFQTLYFKFTDHPESVKLIPRLGVESRGRLRTVFIALVAGILQVIAAAIFIGTFSGISLIPGVILSHLTIIDIESKGDGGQLFMLAIAVWVCCVIIMMMMYQQQEIALLKKFRKSQLNIVFR